MRIFVLAEFLPRPDFSAGDRRLVALLQILAQKHTVDLCILRNEACPETLPAWESGDAQERQKLRSAAEALPDYRKALIESGINLIPFGWKHVGAALANARYDVGIFEYYWITEMYGPVFRNCQPGAKVICDSVDVCFARTERGAVFGQESAEEAEEIKRRELGAFRSSDAVITVSSDDDNLVRSYPGMPKTFLIPIIVPIRPRVSRPVNKECLFVGGFKHYPNVDGVLWFVEHVWPAVRASLPDSVFIIVGSNPPKEITDLHRTVPGVQVTGYVPNTNPFLDRCAISVAPLRWGGGMKGKVAEAIASGVPVVTTSIGAQGFGGINEQDYFRTDDPIQFAEYVVRLLNDPGKQERVGLAGQKLVADLCSAEAIAGTIDRMFDQLLSTNRPSSQFSAAWISYSLGFKAARSLQRFMAEGGALYPLYQRLQTHYVKPSNG